MLEVKIDRLESDLEVARRQKESVDLVLEEEKKANLELVNVLERVEQQLDSMREENREIKKRNKKMETILYGKKL